MACRQCQALDALFNRREAESELRRYHRRGVRGATQQLVSALRAQGVQGATLLDIGGGIGAIQLELLAAGAASATDVDASRGYVAVASEEAQRRGFGDRVSYQFGNFVDLAPTIEAADIVTLDRVICCYPDMPALVSLSSARARRLYGLVYPRDTWWIRLGARVMNALLKLFRQRFRFFVHRSASVDAVARGAGLVETLRQPGLMWQMVLYTRGGASPANG
jgi:magnesium-protoporphyrin O-methyltransferase